MAQRDSASFNLNLVTLRFDPEAFDDALRSQGVPFVHYRAMHCPVGLIDRYDDRRVHDDHSGCSNGFMYTEAGTVTCLFVSNGLESRQHDVGLLDGSTVQITLPRFYDDKDDEIEVAIFDRFYLQAEAVTVPHWQLVEAHISGRDKLSFPAVKVSDIVDSTGRRYGSDEYRLENGQIVWTNGGPGINPETGKGVVYSCRYRYRPYFYVQRIMHQVRVAQVETPLETKLMRMPQSLLLQREHVSEKEEKDELAPDPESPRQVKAPRNGAWGPR